MLFIGCKAVHPNSVHSGPQKHDLRQTNAYLNPLPMYAYKAFIKTFLVTSVSR